MFDRSEIDQLLSAMRANGVTRLSLRRKGKRLRLVLDGTVSPAPTVTLPHTVSVKSPSIGAFQPRGEDDGLPVLEPGAMVSAGELLGYIAQDPVRLPILADTAGRLQGPLPAPGDLAGYGDPLFTLEPET